MATSLFSTPEEVRGFSASLTGAAAGWQVEYAARVASTNEQAVQAARAGADHGRTFTADEQTAGRGRRGRSWLSPPGKGLLFSTVTHGVGLTSDRLGWVALSAGMACAEALRSHTGIDVRLKWPNDLVVMAAGRGHPPWRKLGGILVESSLTGRPETAYAVIGIGVNVLHGPADLPCDARTPVTSLCLLADRSFCRRVLLKALLQHLAERIRWMEGGGEFTALTAEVRGTFAAWWTDWVLQIRTPAGERRGLFEDLDAHGRLCLRDEEGRQEAFSDAEWLDAQPIKA